MNQEKCHLVSWNVNGLKKTNELIKNHNDSLLNFLKKFDIDILCLQETKTNYNEIENNMNALGINLEEYESYWCCCKNKNREHKQNPIQNGILNNNTSHNKGYSGVATIVNKNNRVICATNNPFKQFYFSLNDIHKISKNDLLIKKSSPIDESSVSFYILTEETEKKRFQMEERKGSNSNSCYQREVENFFNEGRIIITYHNTFVIVNIYVPYSGNNLERLNFKMLFLHAVRAKTIQIRLTTGLPIILIGDFNIQYRNKDVHYTNNIIDLEILQKNLNNINLNESLKKKIANAIPLIIKTLKNKSNFTIKRKKIKTKEYFYLYLKMGNVTKQIGTSFESKEELEFFFSLDEYTTKPDIIYEKEKKGEKKKNLDRFYFTLTNPIEFFDTINKKHIEKKEQHFPIISDVFNNQKTKIENEIPQNNIYTDIEIEMNKYFLKNKENIKYNESIKEKIKDCKKIICKYKFKNNSKNGYIIKKKNNIYLQYLNYLFLALNINLTEQDLLLISNICGQSSSPECCVNFFKNLLIEDNMVDTFSYFYPNINGKFTCWDVYKQNRMVNIGSRIDYILVDSVLVENFIRDHTYLYKSPIVFTEHLRKLILTSNSHNRYKLLERSEKNDKNKNEEEIENETYKNEEENNKNKKKEKEENDHDLHYDIINSFENNNKYVTYFGKLKKINKDVLSKMDTNFLDDEMYKAQFEFLSYIGLLYTSPKLSDHIAVNCTFIKKKKNLNNVLPFQKKNQLICCSNVSIFLKHVCNSLNQYIFYMPFFLISTSSFMEHFFSLTNPIHTYPSTCSDMSETQPHKKTNKITQYFLKKVKH